MIKLFIKLISKEAYKKFLFFEQKGGTNTARQITVNEFRLKERKHLSRFNHPILSTIISQKELTAVFISHRA